MYMQAVWGKFIFFLRAITKNLFEPVSEKTTTTVEPKISI